VLGALVLFPAVGWVGACTGALHLSESDHEQVLIHQSLAAPNPAEAGPYAVRTLFYGSGTDKNRAEYRDSVTILTTTVDASKLVDLTRYDEDERNRYWGFSPDSFPLNARVWYPEGPGPFPLALIVHGNHDMKEYSDPGYAYLGRLLASRGFILASVDMNFVNGSVREENDGRGWLLLKHLEAWRGFNEDPGNPFHGRVDLENIALMGHSRGGEAVGHAAAFNRLSHYPDDASLRFDFDFAIRSVVAIAPVDGQYLPTGRKVPVEDVNYLVFHGSHDGDVTSFHGLRQWHRVSYTDLEADWFKASIYVYRANHGQWNEVWGAHDNGPRSGRILDLRALMDPDDQRQFARIYITAFLEATLRGDDRYLPIFRDHRVIGSWLPRTMYVTRFQAASFRPLANFEEDIDVTTGSMRGVRLVADSLRTWREGRLSLRSSNRANTSSSQENQAVWLGWNRRSSSGGEDASSQPGTYEVSLPPGLAETWRLDSSSTLDLAVAPTRRTPRPRGSDEDDDERGQDPGREGSLGDDEAPEDPIDLSVEVEDTAGRVARVALSEYGPVRRPLETRILRRADRERERFDNLWEIVLQGFSIPLGDLLTVTPELELNRLTAVRLVFDRSEAGEIVLDDLGFSRPDPAFLNAAIPSN
jgi:hypothetical protein